MPLRPHWQILFSPISGTVCILSSFFTSTYRLSLSLFQPYSDWRSLLEDLEVALMSSHASSASFFAAYPDFKPDPTASIIAEFNQLAISQNWKKGSKTYKKHKRQCLEEEFNAQYGNNNATSMSKLETWQTFYMELLSRSGTTTTPSSLPGSITQCKKVRWRGRNNFKRCKGRWLRAGLEIITFCMLRLTRNQHHIGGNIYYH